MVECKLGKNWLNYFICHLSFLKKLSPNQTHPLISICEFLKPYKLLFLECESFVKCKIWIVKNKKKTLVSIYKFLKSYKLSFFEFVSFIKCKIWIVKKSLNNFISHLSWFRKLSPTHTYPLISICEFSKSYKLLFFEFDSFINGWM